MESLIGKTIDGYKILEVLGRGGMGVVFKALDESLDKIVALKMIDPFLARDENFVKRFKTEAKALARLENPNIVRVHALRKTEFGLFMVMEYVDAKPLSHWIQEKGSFALKDTISITKQLLSVFDHAHKAGVIHRDIKPSNIMLSDDGNIKVLDFGLAKVMRKHGEEVSTTDIEEVHGSSSISGETHGSSSTGGTTGTGHVVGTMAYSSPEQLQCQQIDGRSDIYCLGLVLYELLTGLRPISGTTVAELLLSQSNMDNKLVLPSKIRTEIPPELDDFVTKMVRYSPSDRQQSSLELIQSVHSLAVFKTTVLEEDNILGTATRVKAESKHLASLELSDTHYWKAMELFENREFIKGLKEFDKLCTTITELPKQLSKTMSAKLDHLFLTTYPIIPSLSGELPKAYT
ncbi:MAG: serine/threonine protein kinase, partial [Cyclobacteriaceae bacterium]|nr:serine/threonine protein kinase [Cyclobacteriaceae bacterium]